MACANAASSSLPNTLSDYTHKTKSEKSTLQFVRQAAVAHLNSTLKNLAMIPG